MLGKGEARKTNQEWFQDFLIFLHVPCSRSLRRCYSRLQGRNSRKAELSHCVACESFPHSRFGVAIGATTAERLSTATFVLQSQSLLNVVCATLSVAWSFATRIQGRHLVHCTNRCFSMGMKLTKVWNGIDAILMLS